MLQPLIFYLGQGIMLKYVFHPKQYKNMIFKYNIVFLFSFFIIMGLKEKSERLREVINLIQKLNDLGLNGKYEEIKEFHTLLKQYVKDGIYKEGKINVYGTKRQINYTLPEKEGKEISVLLKYKENI